MTIVNATVTTQSRAAYVRSAAVLYARYSLSVHASTLSSYLIACFPANS